VIIRSQAAAESWVADDDATVFTFHLREDATFHDGTPVTAESFVQAWEAIADRTVDEPSSAHYLLDMVAGIEEARAGGALTGAVAIDDHTLEVTLVGPYADFAAVVSHPALAPVSADAAARADHRRLPVGNGPFRMAEPWQPGQFIRIEPFGDHPRAPTDLTQVVFRIYEGENAVERGYDDFIRGHLDMTPLPDGVHEDAVSRFGRSADGYTGPGVLDGLRATTVFYTFNVEVAPFDDPVVRQALALLVDRPGTQDPVREVARSVVPPLFPDYESPECPYCSFDPERARDLLEEHEVELDGLELVYFDTPEHEQAAQRVVEAVNDTLGEGTLTARGLEHEEWVETIRGGETGFFLSGWMAEFLTVGAFLDPLFHPGWIGTDNLSRYADPDMRDLLSAARAEQEPQARNELYRQAEGAVLEDVPVIPLTFYRQAKVVSERTAGLIVDPMGRVDLTEVSLREGE
jgi:oligopeptide transport system substrate-binding protein